MTKEVTRKLNAKTKHELGRRGAADLEALAALPEEGRSMERLEAAENNELHISALTPGQQRQFSPNLMAAAPGGRDQRFDGLRGEERIAAAVEIGGLANIGDDLLLSGDTTLGEIERLRMSGADGVSGMEDNPEIKPRSTEYYDGHRFHVVRDIGTYAPGGGSVIVDISTPGDNDEDFNAEFVSSIEGILANLHIPRDAEKEHSGLVAERLFRHWRTLGGSFDPESVGEIAVVKARNGVNMTQMFAIAFLGGVSAMIAIVAALYLFGSYLPPLTN